MNEKDFNKILEDHERRIKAIENLIEDKTLKVSDDNFPYFEKFELNKKEIERRTKTLTIQIDRTAYPAMKNFNDKDSAIYLLYITKQDFGINGLITSQIVELLNERFNKDVKKNTISIGLLRADEYVNRIKINLTEKQIAYLCKIVPNGEDYIKKKIK